MPIGKTSEFDVKSGNWTLYIERLEMYFKVNEVKKDLWLPNLIAVMGDEAYELLSNLISPYKPSDKTYEYIVKTFLEHLQPKRSVVAERYYYRQRRQFKTETILQYISELKRLTKFCNFGATLEENLRDQLVCGLASDVIRQRLFAEDNLDYANAVRLACAMEAAERRSGGAARSREFVRERGWRDGSTRIYERCKVCGSVDHPWEECRFKRFVCGKCKQRGHLRRVCPGRFYDKINTRRLHHVTEEPSTEQPAGHVDDCVSEEDPGSDYEDEEELHQLSLNGYKPVSLPVFIDNFKLLMEVDTGSAVSCINKLTYDKYFSHRPMENPSLSLKLYDGTKIRPVGVIKPTVKYEEINKSLELFVIEGGATSLLGRQWLTELKIQIPKFVNYVCKLDKHVKSDCDSLTSLIHSHDELFSGGLGRFTGGKATLRVRPGAVPVFHRARPVPYALRERLDAELDAMLRDGIIEPVDYSDWATPLVPVRKADGGLRICADYKVTLNPVLLVDRYPLPRIDDLLVGLNGAKIFSKIDLSQAYNQVELDDSKYLTVINTHRGLFKYNRLVYGLSSSPGIFQRIMASILSDIPHVEVFLDDVILGTPTKELHLQVLGRVFERLRQYGMKLKKNKCVFMVDEVKYLGFIISKDGIKTDPDKTRAIAKMPRPKDVPELRSFLGLVNFYAKFVKNISSLLAPLYELLKKKVKWNWSPSCENAYKEIKSILISAQVLAHYDPKKPLFLTCDASARGIGGTLTQPGAGGERPVVFVSRALTDAEKHYSQIDREALAIVFCFRKLHQYLYGRRFTLRTDHKPLVSIFGSKQGIPTMAASRMQRWAIILSAYTYDITYINTKQNAADGLSRLPLPIDNSPKKLSLTTEQTYLHFAENEMLLDYNEIRKHTLKDPILGRILNYIRDGWPIENEIKALQPFFNRKKELYEELSCVMWGHRVVIPDACKTKVLLELHEPHMGIVKTKAIARSYVWWAGIDEAVENMCRSCVTCAAEADAPPRQAPKPWPWPSRPWSRLHIDFLGPIFNKIYLVVIDARTKWLEVFQVPSTSATHTISRLSELFARWGLPKQIVSDNGPPFTSKELHIFLSNRGITHIFTAPYHPASNGAAENAVRTVKKAIKKAIRLKTDVNLYLDKFLLYYRNTPHCTLGESPASLMLGRSLRTKLDILRPDPKQKIILDKVSSSNTKSLHPGEEVWLRQYQGPQRWVSGRVSECLGSSDYKIIDEVGRNCHRHIDQLKRKSRGSILGLSHESPSAIPSTSDQPLNQDSLPDVTPADVVTDADHEEHTMVTDAASQPLSTRDPLVVTSSPDKPVLPPTGARAPRPILKPRLPHRASNETTASSRWSPAETLEAQHVVDQRDYEGLQNVNLLIRFTFRKTAVLKISIYGPPYPSFGFTLAPEPDETTTPKSLRDFTKLSEDSDEDYQPTYTLRNTIKTINETNTPQDFDDINRNIYKTDTPKEFVNTNSYEIASTTTERKYHMAKYKRPLESNNLMKIPRLRTRLRKAMRRRAERRYIDRMRGEMKSGE
ncbi:hypothetical protein evm_008920 [Chilo suppressalis]|nr:hypothetical protein evm_008920 [Chilo suppressalis]